MQILQGAHRFCSGVREHRLPALVHVAQIHQHSCNPLTAILLIQGVMKIIVVRPASHKAFRESQAGWA